MKTEGVSMSLEINHKYLKHLIVALGLNAKACNMKIRLPIFIIYLIEIVFKKLSRLSFCEFKKS